MKTRHILIFGVLLCCIWYLADEQKLEPSVTNPVGLFDYDISKRLYRQNQRNADNASPEILQQQIFDANTLMVGDPVTISLAYAALKGLIGGLEATIRTLSGDIAEHLNHLLSTTRAVMAEWGQRLADRLDERLPSPSAYQNRTTVFLSGATEGLTKKTGCCPHPLRCLQQPVY